MTPLQRRLLLVGENWHSETSGGLNTYFSSLATALFARPDTNVRAIVLGRGDNAPGFVVPLNVRDRPYPLRVWHVYKEVRRYAKSADALNLHFAPYGIGALASRRVRRLPVVVNFQGPWAAESRTAGDSSRVRYFLRAALERVVYHRGDVVIVLSPDFRSILVKEYGVPADRVRIISPGVDQSRFFPRVDARKALGIEARVPLALSVRRLTPRMGLDVLIRAWAGVRPDNAVLSIAGTGAAEGSLRSLAEGCGVSHRVIFLGRVPDDALPLWYSAADVSVVPTLELEGFGLVVLESLACGTPVVASATGGLTLVLEKISPELLVPSGDAAALANRISDFLLHRDRHLSPDDAVAAARHYSWDIVANHVIRAVHDASSYREQV